MNDELIKTMVEQNEMLKDTIEQLLRTIQIQNQTTSTSGQYRGVPGTSFDKYDEDTEDFETYTDRLTAFFRMQGIPEDKKVLCFVSLMGPKLFQLLKNLLYPQNFENKTFEELKQILKEHLNPRPLIIPARHALLNRKQKEGETIAQYLAELRKLAAPCKYPDTMLNIVLRDIFVSGLHSRAILDRLFEEDDITLEKTVDIAAAIEKATCGANEILNQTGNNQIHKVDRQIRNSNKRNKYKKEDTKYKNQNTKYTRPSDTKCLRCGDKSHNANKCYKRNLQCNFCKRTGHVYDVCFRRKNNVNVVETLDDDDNCSLQNNQDENVAPIFNVKFSNCPPMKLDVQINGKNIEMEIDTGSAATIISSETLKQIPRLGCGKLLETKVTFKTYDQNLIRPIGSALVNVKYKSFEGNLSLYVVKGNHTSIMGRGWINKLNIFPTNVNLVEANENYDLKKLLQKFSNLFDGEVCPVKNCMYDIQMKENTQPRFLRARQVPFSLQTRVEAEIHRLEKEGTITKVNSADWATPIVPVVKPNNSIRLCADYSQTVNNQMIVPQHPFPGFEEVLFKLRGGQLFSTLDVRTAFLHIPVTERTANILTINTHLGLYKVNRLMFGVSSAPAIWQKYIEDVLKEIPGTCVVHDDIIITGGNTEEHINNLRAVFEQLAKNEIKLNANKCKYLENEVKYLGFVIDKKGIKKTEEMVNAILQCKRPTTKQEVKSFMGMVGFYARFCPDLSIKAEPLYKLTRNNVPFEWTTLQEESFDAIRKDIASEKVLVHYDPKLPLVLSVDASPIGLGAVLSHLIDGQERPIVFASRTLQPSERNYSQLDKEALAIYWGVSKLYHYLYGRHFTLYTDHRPLMYIFKRDSKLPVLRATRLLRYALFLQTFYFDIKYRRSEEHGNADFLSRLPLHSTELEWENSRIDECSLFHLEQINTLTVTCKDLQKATKEDSYLRVIYEKLRNGNCLGSDTIDFSLQHDCVFKGIRICVPRKYQEQILKELHEGHVGMVKMKALARSHVYWPNIDKDIEDMVNSCAQCIELRNEPKKVPTHYWEYPTQPWERIHLDFAGPFQGHMFMLVVDAHSKWVEVSNVSTASTNVVMNVLETLFARYGLPRTLVSDNATCFTSAQFQQFLRTYNIKHVTCAPFHPASNGQAERYVFTFKQALKSLKNYQGDMQKRLNTFLYTYRRAPNVTTNESPAKLFLGREIRSKLDILRPDPIKEVTSKLHKETTCFNDRTYQVGETVAVRSYDNPNRKWVIGKVINKDGILNYSVLVNGHVWRRHVDQIQAVHQSVPPTREPVIIPFKVKETAKKSSLSENTNENQTKRKSERIDDGSLDDHTGKTESMAKIRPHENDMAICQRPEETLRRSSRIRKAPDRLNL